MKINCLSCGHKVELDDAYANYEGQIKCFTCGSMLKIKIGEGDIYSVTFVNLSPNRLSEASNVSTHQIDNTNAREE